MSRLPWKRPFIAILLFGFALALASPSARADGSTGSVPSLPRGSHVPALMRLPSGEIVPVGNPTPAPPPGQSPSHAANSGATAAPRSVPVASTPRRAAPEPSGIGLAPQRPPASLRADGIVTYLIVNRSTKATVATPVTFGSVFAKGDVPKGAAIEAIDGSGRILPTQLDIKARHPDGSVRHAVVTVIAPPMDPSAELPVTLRRGATKASTGPARPQDLPSFLDMVVRLDGDRRLSASLQRLLAGAKPEAWLSGPLAGEWWLTGPFVDASGEPDPQLHVRFGIRSYGPGQPARIEVVVENGWTWVPHPRTEIYDAKITVGGNTVFDKAAIHQPSNTRWRQVLWSEPHADLYVKQNLAYLKKARVIPNYDETVTPSEMTLGNDYARFEKSDHGPMGGGILQPYMPSTGGRPDIGPLPRWAVVYLLSMDWRANEITLRTGDLAGSWPIHYRSEKTGRPMTLEEFPNFTTHFNFRGKPEHPPLEDDRGYKDPLVPDASHEPSLAFVPYLVTGDRYYLEELQFWTEWNATGTAPGYREYEKGLVHFDQVRAQAWSLRTLAQTAFITPDDDPLKAVFRRQLHANIEWYNATYTSNPKANGMHMIYRGADVGNGPWMDDFFTWTTDYMVQLGFADALPLLRWKAKFPVGRMLDPGFCWVVASVFRLYTAPATNVPYYDTLGEAYRVTLPTLIKNGAKPDGLSCGSSAMADALGLRPGEMWGHASEPMGFPSNLQPALAAAVDSDIDGAKRAWALFMARTVKPDYRESPQWDIVPWDGNH